MGSEVIEASLGFGPWVYGLRGSDQRIQPKYRLSKLDLDNLKRFKNSMPGKNTVYIAEFPIKFCPNAFCGTKRAFYQIILTKIKRQFCMTLLPFE